MVLPVLAAYHRFFASRFKWFGVTPSGYIVRLIEYWIDPKTTILCHLA